MKPHRFLAAIDAADPVARYGHVTAVADAAITADGPVAPLGALCRIDTATGTVAAEVAAIDRQRLVLVPLDRAGAIALGDRVVAQPHAADTPVGDAFAGRAIDALARPIDGGPAILADARRPLAGMVPRPLDRASPRVVVATGIRAIDGPLTLARGQRVGIFAAAGVGKTSLLEQIATQAQADRTVVCLAGERGREVEAFWRVLAARDDAARFTLVAATSDESAPMRARAVHTALALAEHWRDAGEHVLLVVDSVTRLAMALRAIGLAAGAPPTVRAYTPNVFAALPRLVERCGALASGGAITAVMTVLAETDDIDDPIVETMKSLLDGHILLSRHLAEQGHFPAIDVARSISRRADRLVQPDHAAAARDLVALLAAHDEARVMIESGVYKAGSNPLVDRAIAARDRIAAFLRQPQNEAAPFADTVRQLARAVARG